MLKIFLASAMGLALVSALPALELSLHSGCTSFGLGELNRANAQFTGYAKYARSQDLRSGLVVGADALSAPADGLQFGLRAEAMQSEEAENRSDKGGLGTTDVVDQAALTTVLLGVRASTLRSGMNLGLGAWAGYGYATLQQHCGLNPNQAVQDGLFMGSLPVAELEATLAYGLGHGFSLSVLGGWRWANAGALYDDTHHALLDNGQAWNHGLGDPAGRIPLDLDYSGVSAQGSVSYSF